MAKKQSEDKKEKKVFNFGESPLVKKTEQTVVEGYQRIEESEEQGERQRVGDGTSGMGVNPEKVETPAVAPETPAAEVKTVDPEETKGIQAYIPMSLYERLVMRKLRTKEPLGSMFQQAMQMWIDVQEGKLKVIKP